MPTPEPKWSTDRKLTKKGERRRGEILSVSAELFDRRGYHQTTIALIAQEIGTTKANVYHYFRAKHDILFAIHQDRIEDLIRRFDEMIASPRTVEEQLRDVVHHIIGVIAEHRSQIRVYFEYLRELPVELRELSQVQRDDLAERVESLLSRGMEDGTIRTLPLKTATFAFFGMVNWTYQWYRQDGAQSPPEVADQIFDMFWRGVTTGPSDAFQDTHLVV